MLDQDHEEASHLTYLLEVAHELKNARFVGPTGGNIVPADWLVPIPALVPMFSVVLDDAYSSIVS